MFVNHERRYSFLKSPTFASWCPHNTKVFIFKSLRLCRSSSSFFVNKTLSDLAITVLLFKVPFSGVYGFSLTGPCQNEKKKKKTVECLLNFLNTGCFFSICFILSTSESSEKRFKSLSILGNIPIMFAVKKGLTVISLPNYPVPSEIATKKTTRHPRVTRKYLTQFNT